MKRLSLIILNLALLFSAFAQDYFRLYWEPNENGNSFTICATKGQNFTVNWDLDNPTIQTFTGTGENMYIEYFYDDSIYFPITVDINAVTYNCRFTHFIANNEKITGIVFFDCNELSYLDIRNNSLTYLHLENCPGLLYLDCSNNNLTGLNIKKMS